jgi:hypothetical protein
VKLSDEAGQMKDKVNSHLNDIANKTDEAKGAALIGMKPITGLTGDNVRTAMQNLFQYANDGKTAVANAVTAKGVSASPTDTFSVLATKIGQINTGKRIATGSVSLSGSTATVNNLSFKPSQVIFYLVTSVSDTMYGKGCVAKGSYFEHPQLYFTNYNSAEPSTVGISNLTFSDTGFVATFNMAGSVTSFYISGYVAIE